MKKGEPSRTAEWVARLRAAHQLLDAAPHVLEDPLAVRILSAEQRELIVPETESQQAMAARPLRAFLVARSRYAEDSLEWAVSQGVRQYVVLGAGLDTFAYRSPYPHLRVFEVDHPATQAWKRECLAAAAIPVPETVTFAPVDFGAEPLAEGLAAAGFDASQATFFTWLGVTPYITRESFQSTLDFIAARPVGSGVALDYALAREELAPKSQRTLEGVMGHVDQLGEPFQLFFTRAQLENQLTLSGFQEVESLDDEALRSRYFKHRPDGLEPRDSLGQMASAWIHTP